MKTKKQNPKKKNNQEVIDDQGGLVIIQNDVQEDKISRTIGLFGDVGEQTCADVISNLIVLSKTGEIPKNERKNKYTHEPIEF